MSGVLILNPNSSWSVTRAIEGIAAACLSSGSYAVEQIDDGPPVIEDEADGRRAAELVCERLDAGHYPYDAFVVACHGDPGVAEATRMTGKPVCGIGAASFRAAAALGGRFGVITLGRQLVVSKWRQVARSGLDERCVSVEPTETGVLHVVGSEVPDLTPYVAAARRAIGQGATALVLGCAGMAPTAAAIEREVGVPVIEPVGAGIREAARAAGLTSRAWTL
jgi:allantoin racemase